MENYEIETANGVYTLKKPTGRIGLINFSLISKSQPKSQEKDKDGNIMLSPADEDRMQRAMLEWGEKVLKHILVEEKSDFKYEDIPGEDQFILFMAISSKINISSDELFRFK